MIGHHLSTGDSCPTLQAAKLNSLSSKWLVINSLKFSHALETPEALS